MLHFTCCCQLFSGGNRRSSYMQHAGSKWRRRRGYLTTPSWGLTWYRTHSKVQWRVQSSVGWARYTGTHSRVSFWREIKSSNTPAGIVVEYHHFLVVRESYSMRWWSIMMVNAIKMMLMRMTTTKILMRMRTTMKMMLMLLTCWLLYRLNLPITNPPLSHPLHCLTLVIAVAHPANWPVIALHWKCIALHHLHYIGNMMAHPANNITVCCITLKMHILHWNILHYITSDCATCNQVACHTLLIDQWLHYIGNA